MTERIVEAEGLVKRYGKLTALDGLDLVAEPGQVLAVLGPNGAGKTTFVRTIATLLRPDGGSLRVAGHDVRREPEAVRRLIGLAGQFAAVEPALSGRENLEMVARLFGQDRRAARADSTEVLDAAWPGRGRRPAGPNVLGRHAAQARPGREPGGFAPAAAARRADDRPRSTEPRRAVGRHPLDGRAGNRRPADDAVPGRGRSPRWSRGDHRPRPSGRHRDAERAQAPRRPQRGRGARSGPPGAPDGGERAGQDRRGRARDRRGDAPDRRSGGAGTDEPETCSARSMPWGSRPTTSRSGRRRWTRCSSR